MTPAPTHDIHTIDIKDLANTLSNLDAPEGEANPPAAESLRRVRRQLARGFSAAWRQVVVGNLDAPASLKRDLQEVSTQVERLVPNLTATQRAALETEFALRHLDWACSTLADIESERRIGSGEPSALDRAVLGALGETPKRFLKRSEVTERIDTDHTPNRVGQVLASLHEEGFLQRRRGMAQGNARTSFYMLSGKGRRIAEELGLIEKIESPEKVRRLAAGARAEHRDELKLNPKPGSFHTNFYKISGSSQGPRKGRSLHDLVNSADVDTEDQAEERPEGRLTTATT